MAEDVFGVVGTTQADQFRVEQAVAKLVDGVMYRAQHTGFNAPVALKCFEFPGEVSEAQRTTFTEKFRAEAELSFRLSTSIPELVRPLHVGGMTVAGKKFVPFIAYEWLEGSTLEQLIADRAAFGLEPLVKLLSPLARALSRAHEFPPAQDGEPVIHGDVRTQNIIVTMQDGLETVRLRDFGVLRARNSALLKELGDDLAIIGSSAAPEQWRPQRYGAAGPWTDVWGLALAMVEGLAGHAPISGNNATMMGIALDNRKRPSPRAWGVSVPDPVEKIFLAALAVDPGQRTGTIREFWEALTAAIGLPSTFEDARLMGMPVGSAGSDFPEAGPGPSVPKLGTPGLPRGLGLSKPPGRPPPGRPPPRKPPPPAAAQTLAAPTFGGDLELDLPPPPQVAKSSIPPPPDAASGLELGVELGPSLRPGSVSGVPSAAPGVLSGAPGAAGVQINIPDSASPSAGSAAPGAPPESGPHSAAPAGMPSGAPASGPHSAAPASGPHSAAPGSGPHSAAPASGPHSAAPASGPHSAAPASGAVVSRPGSVPSFGPASFSAGGGPPPSSQAAHFFKQLVAPDVDQDIKTRLRFPAGLVIGAIVLTIIDIVVARVADSPISAGPVTIKWLSIPLALAGVGLGIWQLLQAERDDDD